MSLKLKKLMIAVVLSCFR